MNKIKVVIVDDHLLFSNALNGLLSNFEEFEVLGIAENGIDLISLLERCEREPDIVLMDIKMPKMNGIEAAEWLKTHRSNIKTLALSMEYDEKTILHMLRAGAKGYLLKDIHPEVLRHALNEVFNNGFYYTENVTHSLMNSIGTTKLASGVSLKEREMEFLSLACKELTYKEIANEMCLSPKTVENYREALFEKLNVKSRIGLVIYAIKEKLVIL